VQEAYLYSIHSVDNYGRITNGPWIINPLVPPDTTPEQIIAGVTPEGVVTLSVLPVIFVKAPVVNVAVTPVVVVPVKDVNAPVVNVAVTPVVVVPVREVKSPVVNVAVTPVVVVPVSETKVPVVA
jgi:hypothetical protein